MPPFNRARFTTPRAATTPALGDADLWDLLDQARDGDGHAFGRFFDTTAATVYAYVARRLVGDRESAEEITADVYLAAWRALARVERRASNPTAWLMTIASRRVIDHYRAQSRRAATRTAWLATLDDQRRVQAVVGGELVTGSAESTCIDQDQARTLWQHAERLSFNQHRVLRCRFEFGLSIEDTAAQLGKPAAAVKSLQYRALQALRAQLHGTDLDPAVGGTLAAA